VLMWKVADFSEVSVHFYNITLRYNSEYSTPPP